MTPPGWTYWLELGATALLTSVVSGVMGMAGGMLLLAVMLLKLEPAIAIPVHGIVQLVSNSRSAPSLAQPSERACSIASPKGHFASV